MPFSAVPDTGWFVRLPRSVRRLAAKAPAKLYDAGLGWVFGHRFMLLTHRGRRSGRLYQTMLEVTLYDREAHEATVMSGTGAGADWYRNIQASPPVEVRLGAERFMATVRSLEGEERREWQREFARRHPLENRIASWLGMAEMPMVVFQLSSAGERSLPGPSSDS